MSSKFREHLSVVLPPDQPVEISRFSLTSTITPSPSRSFTRGSPRQPKPPNAAYSPKDAEAGSPPPSSTSIRDRFTNLFHDLGLRNTAHTEPIPLHLPQCRPLRIEKRCRWCHVHDPKYEIRMRKQRRRSQYLFILLLILLLFLIGNVIFLDIRVLSLSTPLPTSQTTSTAQPLSADAQQCLSQYMLDAPTSPRNYPCSTCLSVLQAVPSSYTSNSANHQNTQQISNAIQFCGLRAIYETANAQGQATLGNGSWAQNVNFCNWTGVSCNTLEQVSSLQLTYPGVPATLPNEIGNLNTLQSLEVIGGNSIPAGSLPSSFTNLTSLTTLRLEATSITALPDSLFAPPGLTRLSRLALVRNTQMGSTLPSSLTNLTALQSLLVNSQTLSPLLATLAASPALANSLYTLDLTSTSLTDSIPNALSSFEGLTQLLLGSNNLTGTVPPLPSSLQVLELDGNAELSGSITCAPTPLMQCSVQGTTISVGGCGVCQDNATSALRS